MKYEVSSNHIRHCKFVGILPNLYVLTQTMGTVDCCLDAILGSNTFKIHIYFDSIVSMFIRVMKATTAKKCSTQLVTMFKVLRFLVTPDECYHLFIEHYLEILHDTNKVNCGLFCTFCCGDGGEFTGRFYRQKVEIITIHRLPQKGKHASL